MDDPNTFGLVLIAVAVAAVIVRLATYNRPALRAWSRLSALAIIVMVVGLMGFFASAFLAGWYGGIGD